MKRIQSLTTLHMLLLSILLLATTGATCGEPLPAEHAATRVILVRHAEKTSGSDPALTAAGRERALALVRMTRAASVDAVYASQFQRTQETVAPLAEALGVEVQVAPIEIADLAGYARKFAERVLREHRGGTVVIAGHSNTVPLLIQAFGVQPAPAIDENDFDDLFVVSAGAGPPSLLHLEYGAATPAPAR